MSHVGSACWLWVVHRRCVWCRDSLPAKTSDLALARRRKKNESTQFRTQPSVGNLPPRFFTNLKYLISSLLSSSQNGFVSTADSHFKHGPVRTTAILPPTHQAISSNRWCRRTIANVSISQYSRNCLRMMATSSVSYCPSAMRAN